MAGVSKVGKSPGYQLVSHSVPRIEASLCDLILACCTTLLCPQGAFTYTGLLILTKPNKNCYVGIFLLLPIKKLRFRGGSWLSRGHTACEQQNPVSSPDLLIHPTPQLLFLPSLGCICIIHISEHINIEWGDTPKCWHIIQIILNTTFFFLE